MRLPQAGLIESADLSFYFCFGVAPLCRFSILTARMPKSHSPGYGRPCLLIARSADGPVAKILVEAGFEVEAVAVIPDRATKSAAKRGSAKAMKKPAKKKKRR